MNVLIVEDDPTSGLILQRAVSRGGHSATVAEDGDQALELLRHDATYDVVLVDLVLPGSDGFVVIAQARARLPRSTVLVTTAMSSLDARQRAQQAGADDFIVKPYVPADILARLNALQTAPAATPRAGTTATFWGVGVTAGGGGPSVLRELFKDLPANLPAAFFVIQQGPDFVVSALITMLASARGLAVRRAQDGDLVAPGTVYLATPESHLVVEAGSAGLTIRLLTTPPVNWQRPSADTLFESLADTFGDRALGLVLTGMGCDGRKGAMAIHQAGGKVRVQDPTTALHSAMPQNVLDLALSSGGQPIADLAEGLLQLL